MARQNRATSASEPEHNSIGVRILRAAAWLGAVGVWAFIAASLISFSPMDPPHAMVVPAREQAQNWCGTYGSWLAFESLRTLGITVWLPMVASAWALVAASMGARVPHPLLRAMGVGVCTVGLASLLTLAAPAAGAGMAGLAQPPAGRVLGLPLVAGPMGGEVGAAVASELLGRIGAFGTAGLSLLSVFVGLLVWADRYALAVPRVAATAARQTARGGARAAAAGGALAAPAGGGARTALGGLWRAMSRSEPAVRANDVDDDERMPRPKLVANPRRRTPGSKVSDASGLWDQEALEGESAPPAKGRRRRARAEEYEDESAYDAEAVEEANTQAAEYEEEGEWDEEDGEWEESGEEEDAGVEAGEDGEDDDAEDEEAGLNAPQVFDSDRLRERMDKLNVRFAALDRRAATDADLLEMQQSSELEGYRFPGMDLLAEPDVGFESKLEELVRENAAALEAALAEFKIDGEVADVESGPTITLYHVRLPPGTKVSRVQAVASDLARSMKAVNVRIVPNIVGRDTIGVEVPNQRKEAVRLKELMASRELFETMRLPMFLGKDAAGRPLIGDLTQMPHMLIAGTTGSGKSVCMNTIIISWLYTKKPSELKMVLVDPKMVEMSQFRDIPHLMCPVVTEMSKAASILEWACAKMDERYELLARAGCRDIVSYNDMEWEEVKEALGIASDEQAARARIPRSLPYMVFIIDELADLMMTNKEVEGSIIRIAQKARAVGIHLILATQRPQADVVTGLIKSNMPCRVSFKVRSGTDSRIVLDSKGGELLLGHGDMLFLSPSNELIRAQGTFVDDKEIRRVTKFLKEVAAPTFERSLVQLQGGMSADEIKVMESRNNSSASLAAAQEDPMFDRAVEIVLETKRGSVSLLQRRLQIGYTRASRLIDLMGIAGIISAHKGSVARDVMITIEEWDAMKQLHARQLAELEREGRRLEPLEGGRRHDEHDEDVEHRIADDDEFDDELDEAGEAGVDSEDDDGDDGDDDDRPGPSAGPPGSAAPEEHPPFEPTVRPVSRPAKAQDPAPRSAPPRASLTEAKLEQGRARPSLPTPVGGWSAASPERLQGIASNAGAAASVASATAAVRLEKAALAAGARGAAVGDDRSADEPEAVDEAADVGYEDDVADEEFVADDAGAADSQADDEDAESGDESDEASDEDDGEWEYEYEYVDEDEEGELEEGEWEEDGDAGDDDGRGGVA